MTKECKHDWKEEYYGIRCVKCDLFYPDNGNYFAPDDDVEGVEEWEDSEELENEELQNDCHR